MEEEEKAAQSAKLQELIRRGGPEDLQEANRLMKVMAGYDTKHKTDYRAKAAEEVSKIQQKARLLEERLQNFKAGDEVADGDIFEELANALQSAHPKIQKMCEEESDDSEAVAKLLEINDSIHRTIERYKFIKKGDVDAASKIPQGTLGTSTGVRKTADNELSLIDFGGDEAQSTGVSADGPSDPKTASLQDDLLGLSVQDQEFGQGGGIALGFGANTSKSIPHMQMAYLSSMRRRSWSVLTLLANTAKLCQRVGDKHTTKTRTGSLHTKTKLRPLFVTYRFAAIKINDSLPPSITTGCKTVATSIGSFCSSVLGPKTTFAFSLRSTISATIFITICLIV